MRKLRNLFSALLLVVAFSFNAIPSYATEYPELDMVGFSDAGQILTSKIGEVADINASAPPLSSMSLYMIFSEKGGTETVSTSTTDFPITSSNDHGGTVLRAITVEMDYAKNRYATFNNIQMTLTNVEGFDVDGDSIIDGHFCLWTYSGAEFEAGTFVVQATSVNYPWNTLSLRFNVQ